MTLLATVVLASAQPELQRLPNGAAVRVADGPLVFTGLVTGSYRGSDVAQQAASALVALGEVLGAAGSGLERMARLNVIVAPDGDASAVRAELVRRLPALPALTVVQSPLVQSGAGVALDAVAASSQAADVVRLVASGAAILPAGGKIFISGQAEKGPDLASATRLTMAGLFRSLDHLGLKRSDVVQVRAFITPFADHAAATREIAASFEGKAPPTVLIEWVSDLYAEIEIVVSARALGKGPEGPISHAWLPWLAASPRYCHVAHVSAGTPLIFVAGIDGGETGDARTQMKTIFAQLGSTLFEAGSSYRHLAKATYYLGGSASRTVLNDIRGGILRSAAAAGSVGTGSEARWPAGADRDDRYRGGAAEVIRARRVLGEQAGPKGHRL